MTPPSSYRDLPKPDRDPAVSAPAPAILRTRQPHLAAQKRYQYNQRIREYGLELSSVAIACECIEPVHLAANRILAVSVVTPDPTSGSIRVTFGVVECYLCRP